MQITRTELYERICGSPLSRVAPELGLSGTALAAICKKYDIPYPGSGYWTRKSLALPVELPPLPVGDNQSITITPARPRTRTAKPGRQSVRRGAKSGVISPLTEHHPILLGVEAHFRRTRDINEGEFLKPYKRLLPDIILSKTALPRALAIANELYVALDTQGYRVLIAPIHEKMRRIEIIEQEVPQKDRRYGRYHSGSIWAPDRPTITYIESVPIGLALTEMTERVTMRYFNGTYHREDSKIIRLAKPWQLVNSWTIEHDQPCGRFRLVAYSPKPDVNWSVSWQETGHQTISTMISQIVNKLETSKNELQTLTTVAEEAAVRRQREWDEMWERHRHQEDERRVAQALSESRQQLAQVIEKWGQAITVERFFAESEARLKNVTNDRQEHLKERLALARSLMGTLDPLDFLGEWLAPCERYKSQYE